MRNADPTRAGNHPARRQAIGFIPRAHEEEESDDVEDELHTLREMWDARQMAEV